MHRLQMVLVIVILAYATINGMTGYSLAKASHIRSQHYTAAIEAATR